ncbi:RNI-like protein [Linnemannia elongata AG-77]|uniref:RNI-like protein n=1 Tax=Linnemannia elongata AG-77 TaxID=1314771 RepID=A0A197JM13_9FUNG|nr:RNI-like protein [Linnemannia elongata AG-77]
MTFRLPNNVRHSREQSFINWMNSTTKGAKTQQIAQEIWKLQKQMNDRLILIQSKTEAILNQQLELAEYPIPRLFIVLPEELTKYDPGNWFRTKFRLHFICECGKHTEPSNSKVAHHLHLAKHEGYLVREPTEFFKKYGPFLLLMLELIKLGTSVAGHIVPALASLKVVELVDSVQQTVESVTAKIDYSLECIDSQLAKVQASSPGDFAITEPRTEMTEQGLANYLSDVEGLEGVELRQLGSFLKTSEEENLLGNLYRMTTSDGHVKWVCRDHYRVSYQEKHVQKLRDVVKLARGEFDEQLGRIEIVLESRFAAGEFYSAVSKAKGVLELIVELRWECTRSDLEAFHDALKKSRVPVLRLDLGQFGTTLGHTTFSKLIPTSRYKALSSITELRSIKTVHIVLPKDFVMLSSFHPKRPSHLLELSFELVAGPFGAKELVPLADALKTNSTLTALDLQDNKIGSREAQIIAEALKTNAKLITLHLGNNMIGDNGAQSLCVALKINSTLTTLDLKGNLIRDVGALALSEALKTNSTLTTLDLKGNSIWFGGLLAFSEALKDNSTLTTLDLYYNSIGDDGAKALTDALKTNSTLTTLILELNKIGDHGAKALADALKTNSTLTTLNLQNNSIGSDGAKALAEALKTNSTLTTLNLLQNRIGDNGAQALAEALKTNLTLTILK